jgi:hypothetical protein
LFLMLAGAAPAGLWQPLEFLVGEWRGEGSGGPGQGSGGFTFAWDLQKAVLVRKNHAEYPAQQGRPAAVHDDLTVISVEGDRLRADYWDNEGHVIRYAVGAPPGKPEAFKTYIEAGARRRVSR